MMMVSWGKRFAIVIACLFVVWILVGCSSKDEAKEAEATKSETVEVLYNRAANTFAEANYKDAVGEFEEVERQHPFSPWAVKAQVMAAYSAYLDEDYTNATAILDRFVKLHPTHENVPYAYYLKALCSYEQIVDIGRDQKMTQEAMQALNEVVARFPNTPYARDAKLKLDLTIDHLAGKEMEIGRYYLERQDYLAAANRFQYVLSQYQTTTHVPEALHRLVESYLSLGVKAEAKKYASVLGHNYPGSVWYQYSYAMLKGDLSPEHSKDDGVLGGIIPAF